MNRLKLTAPALKSRAEAEEELGRLRATTIARNRLALQREQRVKLIDDQVGPELQRFDKDREVSAELLKAWAEANPGEFGGRKSLEMAHGLIGWRTGMPKLIKRARETWAALVERVRNELGKAYLRTIEEVDRERIIADRDTIPANALRDAGLAVVREESFFAEPRVEESEARQVVGKR